MTAPATGPIDAGSTVRLNVTACGLFHYGRYVEHLDRLGALATFYYSHRVGTRYALASGSSKNLWLKEYLTGAHLRLLSDRGLDAALALYHAVWRHQLERCFRPAEVNLFLLHGNCLPAIRRCRREGGVVIGEAVNLHPLQLTERLREEAGALGLSQTTWVHNVAQILDETEHLDALLVPSSAVAASFERHGFPRSRIKTIAYGAGQAGARAVPPARAPRTASANIAEILVVAHVSLRKGHHLLLRAVERLRSSSPRPLRLRFVGRIDPPYFDALLRMNCPFEHSAHVPHAQLLADMAAADVVVLPSLEDGFGMVVTEALHVGTPVVVSKFAGAAELVALHGGGVVVDPHDTDDFAEGLARALDGRSPPGSPQALPTWADYATQIAAYAAEFPRAVGSRRAA